MLKLVDSYQEARKLARNHPDNYRPGSSGWVQMEFSYRQSAPAGVMERWIDESFRALVPKKIVALLPESGAPKAKKAAKRKSTAKKTTAARKKTTRRRARK